MISLDDLASRDHSEQRSALAYITSGVFDHDCREAGYPCDKIRRACVEIMEMDSLAARKTVIKEMKALLKNWAKKRPGGSGPE